MRLLSKLNKHFVNIRTRFNNFARTAQVESLYIVVGSVAVTSAIIIISTSTNKFELWYSGLFFDNVRKLDNK